MDNVEAVNGLEGVADDLEELARLHPEGSPIGAAHREAAAVYRRAAERIRNSCNMCGVQSWTVCTCYGCSCWERRAKRESDGG